MPKDKSNEKVAVKGCTLVRDDPLRMRGCNAAQESYKTSTEIFKDERRQKKNKK